MNNYRIFGIVCVLGARAGVPPGRGVPACFRVVICATESGGKEIVMAEWNSDQYLKFKKERTQPAVDLARRIELGNVKTALDIGCGPGNSTRVVADRFPEARVTGADNSANMTDKAKELHPELDFIMFDASRDFGMIKEKYDVVFSNACIQWVPDHKRLIPNMMGLLNPGGVLAVQVPMNYKEPVHTIIGALIKSKKWKNKFDEPRIFYTLTQEEYFDILAGISSDFTMWETVYCHRMPSHESILEWYRSTGLRPYLAVLKDCDAADFENDFLEEVKKEYPRQANGEIIFRFPRFFFTAVK